MSILSAEQVARLCHDAGFSGRSLVLAVAVARGESGFDTEAVGDADLQDEVWAASHNLFQVRCLKAERGTGGVRDEIANRDPVHNVRAAWVISAHGTNFRPWSVYQHGLHHQHLPVVWPACAAIDPTVPPLPFEEERPLLLHGATGPAVADLQRRLNAAGFPCEVDGVFGAETHDAVCAFQSSRQLDVDGVVGPQTWAALGARSRQRTGV